MNKKLATGKLVHMALYITMGVVLPLFFHMFTPGLGAVILPMHLPVFLSGILLGPTAGLIVGAITPLLSSLFTGMPPLIPMVPIMVVELAIYGSTSGYINQKINMITSLLIAMVAGRIGAGIIVWVLVYIFGLNQLPSNPIIFIWGSIIKGMPGIVIQLILIPVIIRLIDNYHTGKVGRYV